MWKHLVQQVRHGAMVQKPGQQAHLDASTGLPLTPDCIASYVKVPFYEAMFLCNLQRNVLVSITFQGAERWQTFHAATYLEKKFSILFHNLQRNFSLQDKIYRGGSVLHTQFRPQPCLETAFHCNLQEICLV